MPVRQRVADLNYYLFEGILHPELFDIRRGRTCQREGFRVDLWMIEGGHVVLVGSPRGGVGEVVSPAREVLPWHRLLHTFALAQRTDDAFSCIGAFVYHTSFTREQLAADLFAQEHAALLAAGGEDRLVVDAQPDAPGALAPFTLVDLEVTQKHVAVQAVHAFPDERTFVKMQSLIEVRR